MSSVEYTIDQVLPHTGRMLLLDEIIQCGENEVMCAVTIRPDSVLCEGDKGVPAWVGLEYMAQTTCAYSGVLEARSGSKPSISLLLGSRAFTSKVDYFPVGSRLVITSSMLMRDDDNLAVFDSRILCNGEEWASCDIKAVRPASIHKLIQEQLNEQSN